MAHKRYDYRRQYLDLSLEELKKRLEYMHEKWLHYFASPYCDELADEKWRHVSYLKNRIAGLESKS